MKPVIFDINFNFITPLEGNTCFTVNAQFSSEIPAEEEILVAEFYGGFYTLKTSFFPSHANMEQLFPYQMLLPQGGGDGVVVDRLNEGFVILSARINGIHTTSSVFEKQVSDTEMRLFLTRSGLPLDARTESLIEYSRAKNITFFDDPGEVTVQMKRRKTVNVLFAAAVVAAGISVTLFLHGYARYTMLSMEKKKIEAEMSAVTFRVSNETLAIIENLESDENILQYLEDIEKLYPVGFKTVTADGIVFKSYEAFENLTKINKKVKIIDANFFFLPADSKLPVEVKAKK